MMEQSDELLRDLYVIECAIRKLMAESAREIATRLDEQIMSLIHPEDWSLTDDEHTEVPDVFIKSLEGE